MPFGLTNAPAAFQWFMNNILCDLLDITVIVYLDNILRFSKDPDKHPEHVREVLKHLRNNQLFCKPSKCSFLVKKVDYLRIMGSPEGISMEEQKVITVQELSKTNTVSRFRRSLGLPISTGDLYPTSAPLSNH